MIATAVNYTTTSHLFTWRGTICSHAPQPPQYTVYQLHFDRPYFHAQHYIGCTTDIDERMYDHTHHRGARLMEVITQEGIGFRIARLWRCETYEDMRALERKIKRQSHGPRFCPLCNPKKVAPCADAEMRLGHWPFFLFEQPGRRRPM